LFYTNAYVLLITHRILSAAFDDRVIAFQNEQFKTAFKNLKAVMPERGTKMISSALRHGGQISGEEQRRIITPGIS
jgi:hypothetical protein